MSTTKDSRTETFLTAMGPKYRYVNSVSFAKLAPNWADINQGRPRARVDDAITEYAELIETGSPAPAPILRLTPEGLDVLDGVQRLCALELLNVTSFSAYIVETDSDALAVQIRVLANPRLQGHTESPKWAKRQAVSVLIIDQGLSVDEVARMGGWKKPDIERLVLVQTWGFAIRCAGGPDDLPDCLIQTIAENAKLDDLQVAGPPIAELCNDLKRGRFSNGTATPHIQAFFGGVRRGNRKKLHDQFVDRLEQFHADPEVATRLEGRKGAELSPEINLRRALKTVVSVSEEVLRDGHVIRYMDEYFGLWNRVEKALKAIAKASKPTKASA